jgi:hypothetical protein
MCDVVHTRQKFFLAAMCSGKTVDFARGAPQPLDDLALFGEVAFRIAPRRLQPDQLAGPGRNSLPWPLVRGLARTCKRTPVIETPYRRRPPLAARPF